MTSDLDIPEYILKDYFILHDEIKKASTLAALEAFNRKTFNTQSRASLTAKRTFYICTGLSIGLIFPGLYFGLHMIEQIQLVINPDQNLGKLLRHRSAALFGLISGLFLLAATYTGFRAYKARDSLKGNDKDRILKNAHHPGIAKQIYEAVEIILANNIPVHTYDRKRKRNLPIHSLLGSRKNAMLILLGDETHRQSLWKDDDIPKGPILIHKEYYLSLIHI